MNILSLVSAMVLILSLGWIACFEQHRTMRTMLTSQHGYCSANQKVANEYERHLFKGMGGTSTFHRNPRQTSSTSKRTEQDKKEKLNQDCARLNLWPLMKGPDKLLHDAVIALLQSQYGIKAAEQFLDAWLAALKGAVDAYPHAIPLEKLVFHTAEQRELYYRMLAGEGYPSLLELVKAESNVSKICPTHATLEFLTTLLGAQRARQFYDAVHAQPPSKGNAGVWQELFRPHCCNARPAQVLLKESDKDSSVTLQKRYSLVQVR